MALYFCVLNSFVNFLFHLFFSIFTCTHTYIWGQTIVIRTARQIRLRVELLNCTTTTRKIRCVQEECIDDFECCMSLTDTLTTKVNLDGFQCTRMDSCVSTRFAALLHAFFYNAWYGSMPNTLCQSCSGFWLIMDRYVCIRMKRTMSRTLC